MPRLRPRPNWSAPGAARMPRRIAAHPVADNSGISPARVRPLLFLDLEASALDPDSWPIEIGCAWFSAGRMRVRSTLIVPRNAWPRDVWSAEAEAMHGLTRENLMTGRPADLVAADTDAFADFTIVSDNAVWDQLWLDRLREGRPRLEVQPLRRVAVERLQGPELDHLVLGLLRTRAPHRAGGDAARLARAWRGAERALPLAA